MHCQKIYVVLIFCLIGVEIAKKISPNIDFRCGDASKLPYEDESFDIVSSIYCFYINP